MGTQSYLSLYVPTTLPCQSTGAMRSPSALLLQENFFFLSRFTFPIKLLLLCERYLCYFCPNVLLHLLFTKQPNPRKKAEKRESSRTLSVLSDDNQRKVKGALTATTPVCGAEVHVLVEKTSWLSLASRPTTSDQWRQATCCIMEEEEGCVLRVYLEVS
jgi:hypothetical protein